MGEMEGLERVEGEELIRFGYRLTLQSSDNNY